MLGGLVWWLVLEVVVVEYYLVVLWLCIVEGVV